MSNGICNTCHSTCLTCNGPTASDCLSCKGNLAPNVSNCASCGSPPVLGYLYLVHLNFSRNYVTFTKMSTNPLYLGFFPKTARVFHWIVFNGPGSVMLNVSASLFQNYHSNGIVFSGNNIIYQGSGIAVAVGLSIDQANVTDYTFTIVSPSSIVCVGLKASYDERTISLTTVDKTTSINVCTNGQDNAVLQKNVPSLTYECTACSGSPELCNFCDPGTYLQPDLITCATKCPDGYFSNATANNCTQCHSSCKTCTGANYTQCISCNTGNYLQPNSTSCMSSCPQGKFRNNQTLTCDSCDIACSACTGSTNNMCISCQGGFYLQPDLMTCLTTCPDGYYKNSSSLICQCKVILSNPN